MIELIPKYKENQVVRAEWEGKSVKARIAEINIFKKIGFIGYRTDTDQHFIEEELSTDFRIGDIVKSEETNAIKLVTRTGNEKANVICVDSVDETYRLLTSSEIDQLSEGDMMSMIDSMILTVTTYSVNEYVVASGRPFDRFKGVQKIKEVKDENDRVTYLIGSCWCCSNDIKKWVPSVGNNVITAKILYSYDCYEDNYIESCYTIIGTVIEVREKENSVVLGDYSTVPIKDLKPYQVNE